MNISMSDEQMRGIVAAAIFEKIPEEDRTKLIQQSIEHLLEVPTEKKQNSWDPEPQSKISQAMERALFTVVREECKAYIEKDGTREKIREIVCDAFDKAFDPENRDDLANKISAVFLTALEKARGY